ncbi:hypothetical protein [Pilimelia columellifera]
MPTPRTPYDAVLAAAEGLPDAPCALDAELVASALLGSVYTLSTGDRAAATRQFVGGFLTATARRRTPAAATARRIFSVLMPDAPGASDVSIGDEPAWLPAVGQVRPTATLAYGDDAGAMTGWVATFAYDDPGLGGPEHAVAVVVDRTVGLVREASVIPSGSVFVAGLKQECAAAGLWTTGSMPSEFPEWMAAWWRATDRSNDVPSGESFGTDRALVVARLSLLGRVPDLARSGSPSPAA